ncbi:hypothetical protein DXT95_08160 [Agrobacterium tumefaciens]|nr:hypothetical protein [Agrobacterium tumefaciens]
MFAWNVWRDTPLCPAGHLPLKGGDRPAARSRPSQRLRMKQRQSFLLISPLSGRCPAGERGCPLSAASTPNYFAAVSAPSGALLLSTCTTTDMPGESSAASG